MDILRGLISTIPVPLTYNNQVGKTVELIEEHFWILNKAFTITSFGLEEQFGKSDFINIIFETSFKNKTLMHKDCQGGIQIQYNIYQS